MRAARKASPTGGKYDKTSAHAKHPDYAHGYDWRTRRPNAPNTASDSALAVRALFGITSTVTRAPKRTTTRSSR